MSILCGVNPSVSELKWTLTIAFVNSLRNMHALLFLPDVFGFRVVHYHFGAITLKRGRGYSAYPTSLYGLPKEAMRSSRAGDGFGNTLTSLLNLVAPPLSNFCFGSSHCSTFSYGFPYSS